jgi:hypothetical protein
MLATEVPGTFRVNGSNKRMRDLQAAFEAPPRVSPGSVVTWSNNGLSCPLRFRSFSSLLLTFVSLLAYCSDVAASCITDYFPTVRQISRLEKRNVYHS